MAYSFPSNFKKGIDHPIWFKKNVYVSQQQTGSCIVCDPRFDSSRLPNFYFLNGTSTSLKYNMVNDGWANTPALSMAGFGAGSSSIIVPEAGPTGLIAAGATASSIIVGTGMPAAVGINQLANKDDGTGYKIRIIDNAAGASGLTEEKTIIGNSSGTTPTITLDSDLTFTPTVGSTYEILSGKKYILSSGALAAGTFKSEDIATGAVSSLANTNLPATIGTDSNLFHISEQMVPSNMTVSQGMLGPLVSTAMALGTITGQAASGDASIATNEYRNFQVRITEDPTAPTAVGQRRRIASHTAGASPVYTLAVNWAVTPTAGAKYVVEPFGDYILCWTTGQVTTYNYSRANNAWDTTTWAVRPSAHVAGHYAASCTSLVLDSNKNARHSYVYTIKGGTSNVIDLFDIAGAATGSWSSDIVYGGKATNNFGSGSSYVHDRLGNEGRYLYAFNGYSYVFRFDLKNCTLEPFSSIPAPNTSAQSLGNRMAIYYYTNSSNEVVSRIYLMFLLPGTTSPTDLLCCDIFI